MYRCLWLCFQLAGCDAVLGIQPIAPPGAAIGYASVVLEDRPLAYFRFDETSGVTAADSVLGGLSGGVEGKVKLGQPSVLSVGAAYGFDGNDSGVTLGDQFGFAGSAAFSIEAWIKPEPEGTNPPYHQIASKWTGGVTSLGWTIYYIGSTIAIKRAHGAQIEIAQSSGLVASTYTHFVGTYDGHLNLYLDGRLVATSGSPTVELPANPNDFIIGASAGDPMDSPMLGSLDEVAIYDHALDPQSVSTHFEAATTP